MTCDNCHIFVLSAVSADINRFQPLNFPGKTLLLEHFASLFGLCQEDVLSVQLDEQTDSKVRKAIIRYTVDVIGIFP